MKLINMLVFALLLCGSAWAETDCRSYFRSTDSINIYTTCLNVERLANALEEIARKMPEPTNLPTAPQPPESTWKNTDTKE